MKSQTLSAYQVPHIMWSIEKKEAQGRNHQSILHILPQSDHLQMSGTKQKNVGHGQENKQNEVFCKIGQKSLASSVEQCSNQKLPKHQCVVGNARGLEPISNSLSDIIPVYDLMVEHDHEFFAWGVLVHNCIDALSMCAYLSETVYFKTDDNYEPEILDEICGF